MITRVRMLKGHMPYEAVQFGSMLYVRRMGDKQRTGDDYYLANGWTGLTDDLRAWLANLGFTGIAAT